MKNRTMKNCVIKNRVARLLSLNGAFLSAGVLLGATLLTLMPISVRAGSFYDTQNHWAQADISRVTDERIMDAFPNGAFRPQSLVTRAEFATFLVRAFGLDASNAFDERTSRFRDVSASMPAMPDINALYTAGMVKGPNFYPNRLITRAEALNLLALASQKNFPNPMVVDQVLSAYSDNAQVPAWARPSVATAIQQGFFVNTPEQMSRIEPNRAASRAEVASMLSLSLPTAPTATKQALATNSRQPQQQPAIQSRAVSTTASQAAAFPTASQAAAFPTASQAAPSLRAMLDQLNGQLTTIETRSNNASVATTAAATPTPNTPAATASFSAGGTVTSNNPINTPPAATAVVASTLNMGNTLNAGAKPPLQGSVSETGELVTVPAQTLFSATLNASLSTAQNRVGDRIMATIDQGIYGSNQQIAIPAGSRINGKVSQAVPAGSGQRNGRMAVEFYELVLANGSVIPFQAGLATRDGYLKSSVAGQGYGQTMSSSINGTSSVLRTAASPRPFGALGRGVMFNSVLGAGTSTLSAFAQESSRRGTDMSLSAGSKVDLRLLVPVSVPVLSSNSTLASPGP